MKKILFIKMSSKLGDSVIESFFIREVQNIYPQSEIHMAFPYSKVCFDFLSSIPYIKNFIFFPEYKKNKLLKVLSILNFLHKIRKSKYDLIIINTLFFNWKRKLFFYLMNGKKIVFVNSDLKQNIKSSYKQILKSLGAKNINDTYEFFPKEQDIEFVNDFIQKLNCNGKKLLLFNPIGAAPYRTFNEDKINEILKVLSSLNNYIVVIPDFDGRYLYLQEKVVIFSNNNFLRLAELVKNIDLMISVDTSLIHLAEAFSKTSIIFYTEGKSLVPINLFESENPNAYKMLINDSVNNINIEDLKKILNEILNK